MGRGSKGLGVGEDNGAQMKEENMREKGYRGGGREDGGEESAGKQLKKAHGGSLSGTKPIS